MLNEILSFRIKMKLAFLFTLSIFSLLLQAVSVFLQEHCTSLRKCFTATALTPDNQIEKTGTVVSIINHNISIRYNENMCVM